MLSLSDRGAQRTLDLAPDAAVAKRRAAPRCPPSPSTLLARRTPHGHVDVVTEKLLLGLVMLSVFSLAVSYAFLESALQDNGFKDVAAER